jgi:hypothetical protein
MRIRVSNASIGLLNISLQISSIFGSNSTRELIESNQKLDVLLVQDFAAYVERLVKN